MINQKTIVMKQEDYLKLPVRQLSQLARDGWDVEYNKDYAVLRWKL